ncbi:MAG TPA: DEAD/DEAH box helicase, partial [Symbiobacteriaceae bacterium]|nr:DEAD/DEAH box helicase [Symbiobacteriaceae bacterium]
GAPSPPQALGWPAIAGGEHTLILAPTGSGKTLAAFLKCLDVLYQEGIAPDAGVQVLYISPLKALNRDIHRNLQEPLAEIAAKAEAVGAPLPHLTAAVRTGDTSQQERARMLRRPPHILITTPESLYLMLTSQARRILSGVRYVIVDEIHALCTTKRGAHLALSLERLEALTGRPPVRIGLSATQRPLEEVARFLGGPGRSVQIVDAGMRKALDLKIEVPIDEMRSLPEGSIWPEIHKRLITLIEEHRSTLIFVNYRGLAERLTEQLNKEAGRPIAKVHHGSMSREIREQVESELKEGILPCVVATSSLELGIDVGAIDLVVQVESPKAVSAGLQRVGRAGHLLGAVAKGRLIPKYRGDLVELACIVREMSAGLVEQTKVPTGGLDVLAQQVTAMAAMDEWRLDDLLALCRRSYPYRDLTERQLETVLQMLAGRYPAEEFRDLRPRIIWDVEAGTIRGREGARSLAILAGGTIPDRGYYGVYMEGSSTRLGELDEEFIYESRVGDVFVLGTASWRIAAVEHDRITVTPAPGVLPRMPFWKGDGIGRPFELGQRVGAFLREVGSNLDDRSLPARLMAECHLDERAAANLISYLRDQQEATGLLPSDRLILAESFWDEAGDRRIVIHSPFGGRVHLAWITLLRRRIRDLLGLEAELLQTDDGILIRLPGADRPPEIEKLLRISPAEAEAMLLEEVDSTPVFGAYFRMNAGRALILPRPRPGRRRPFWIQRMRAADLLQVARRYDTFPIVLETYREVMQDLFDLGGLTRLLEALNTGEIGLQVVETEGPSPMAASVMIGFVGAHMYDDETPKAERQSALLNLNREILRELLGAERLRELLDPRAIQAVSERLHRLAPEWHPRSVDETEDLLRQVGDLTTAECVARGVQPIWLDQLASERRAVRLSLAGEERWVAALDGPTYADPHTYAGPILRRYARVHGPFELAAPSRRYALPLETVRRHLELLAEEGALAIGEFSAGVRGIEYCDLDVLQQIHRQTLALLRAEVEPVDGPTLARFLQAWHGLPAPETSPAGRSSAPPHALRRALAQLHGALLPLDAWEGAILPTRVPNYQPLWLDQLCATGELAWAQAPGGRLALYLPDRIGPYGRRLQGSRPDGLTPEQERIIIALERLGADFLGGIARWSGLTPPEALGALLALARQGIVTNDTGAPLRLSTGKKANPLRAGTGRWSLTSRLLPPELTGVEAYAQILLERYGILTYEAAQAEEGPWTWTELLEALKRMELRGQVRRGYFVAGLSGYQFALPDAVERLRGARGATSEDLTGLAPQDPRRDSGLERVVLLNLCDPANPWGSLLPLPEGVRLARLATNWLVMVGGRPVLAIEGGGKRLTALTDEGEGPQALGALRGLLHGAKRRLDVERWGEEPILHHPVAESLQRLGFERTPRSLVLYR